MPRWPARRTQTIVSCASTLVLFGLVYIGLEGPTDPLKNLAPLSVWTLWWVGFTLATAMFGDMWRTLNPWIGPYRLLRCFAYFPAPRWAGLARRAKYWPAVLGLAGFGWFELVYLAPDEPTALAWMVATYWLLTLLAMIAFGEKWLARGECFSVFFSFIARLAFLRISVKNGVWMAIPGLSLSRRGAVPPSGIAFICLALATVTFDGLSKTFWWLSWAGINPLEFPGRSAVSFFNTFGYLATWALLTTTFVLAVAVGHTLAGTTQRLSLVLGRLAPSLVPIALGYHFAHYLTVFLVNAQYAIAAANDPLGRGSDIFGIAPYYVTTSFLNTHATVEMIWNTQAGG
ncbi:MAG: hypothetical protein ACTSY1_02285, partial [Alphaproteobacteria bacterium]